MSIPIDRSICQYIYTGRPITVTYLLTWRPDKIHKIMIHVQQDTISMEVIKKLYT